jgi:putative endonuclease
MGYIVYILYSKKRSRYYVGQTGDIKKRIKRHNKGYVPSTKSGLPWDLVLTFKVENRSEAMTLEKKIKKRGIKRFLDVNHFWVSRLQRDRTNPG